MAPFDANQRDDSDSGVKGRHGAAQPITGAFLPLGILLRVSQQKKPTAVLPLSPPDTRKDRIHITHHTLLSLQAPLHLPTPSPSPEANGLSPRRHPGPLCINPYTSR